MQVILKGKIYGEFAENSIARALWDKPECYCRFERVFLQIVF